MPSQNQPGKIQANYLYGVANGQAKKHVIKLEELSNTGSLDRTVERTLIQSPEFQPTSISEIQKLQGNKPTDQRTVSRGHASKLLNSKADKQVPVQYLQFKSKDEKGDKQMHHDRSHPDTTQKAGAKKRDPMFKQRQSAEPKRQSDTL